MHGVDPNKSLIRSTVPGNVCRGDAADGVGRSHRAEQRVSREQALRMMTLDAAYLSFDEQSKGSIEVGKLGDLVLLSDDLLTCDAERIGDIQPLMTVLGGKVVHDASSTLNKA
jgi:predicted amidohydrolase YtcJ